MLTIADRFTPPLHGQAVGEGKVFVYLLFQDLTVLFVFMPLFPIPSFVFFFLHSVFPSQGFRIHRNKKVVWKAASGTQRPAQSLTFNYGCNFEQMGFFYSVINVRD